MIRRSFFILLCLSALFGAVGCGGGDDPAIPNYDLGRAPDLSSNNGTPAPQDMGFTPEQESFLVRELATTSSYVFVPNTSAGSHTVVRIDGRDFDVMPLRVGLEPTQVEARDVEGQGAVAYVLCEGDSSLAIIRADELNQDGKKRGQVSLLRLPREVNALRVSPDGRYALAYIDPDLPLLSGTSVASLQTVALVRLGARAGEDEVFQLSVTRSIREVTFTEEGSQLFIVGREGVNHVRLDTIMADRFIAPLPLELSSVAFPPEDLEVEVAPDGAFFVARSSAFAGVMLFALDAQGDLSARREIALAAIPTDIDLLPYTAPERPRLAVTLREADTLLMLDVTRALEDAGSQDHIVAQYPLSPLSGVTQVNPEGTFAAAYSSISVTPQLDLIDLMNDQLESYDLLSKVRSVVFSPGGRTLVVVHQRSATDASLDTLSPQQAFAYQDGLTLLDVATGYARPIIIEGTPLDYVMLPSPGEGARDGLFYVLVSGARQGVLRVDLESYRTDLLALPRTPLQLGVVAGKLFVSQASTTGRITFIDLETSAQRTVSGYELNARID